MPKRCILGCPYYDFAMHRFPDAKKFPERLKTWVNLVGGRLETLSDIEYYKKQVICDIHFCETYRNRNNRLNALAVPTLHLPGLNLSQITSGQASTSTQHNLEPTLIQQENSEPSVSHATSEQPSPSLHNLLPSTSQPIAADPSQTFSLVNNMMMEHNYSAISRPRRKTVKDPAAPLRTKIKQLQTDIMRLRKKGESFKIGRRYYLDFGVLSGFICFLLGLLGLRSRRNQLLPNRNYISGYIVLSTFSLLSAFGLLILLSIQPLPGTALNDITSGAVCSITVKLANIAHKGIFAQRSIHKKIFKL